MITDSSIPSAATIGNFDGVHRGHSLVAATLIDLARERNLRPMAVTFDNHPLALVDPSRAPKALLTPDEKRQRLADLGLTPLMMHFDQKLRMMSAKEYMIFLRDRYNVKLILLGFDNRFGHDRTAGIPEYREAGKHCGVEIAVAPEIPGISSSAIRKMLAAGNISGANDALGYEYTLHGIVTHGKKLGRTIGFPTANLLPEESLLIPAGGVYTGKAILDTGETFPAMINIGSRPTVGDNLPATVEAHLDGFEGDLYNRPMRLSFSSRLRDERKMQSMDELRSQLASDLDTLRRHFSTT